MGSELLRAPMIPDALSGTPVPSTGMFAFKRTAFSFLCAGKAGATLKSNDSMEDVLHVMSHDSILFFTDDGIARSLKAYQIPEVSRTAVGTAITQVRLQTQLKVLYKRHMLEIKRCWRKLANISIIVSN